MRRRFGGDSLQLEIEATKTKAPTRAGRRALHGRDLDDLNPDKTV